jgi:hypothetical protein
MTDEQNKELCALNVKQVKIERAIINKTGDIICQYRQNYGMEYCEMLINQETISLENELACIKQQIEALRNT